MTRVPYPRVSTTGSSGGFGIPRSRNTFGPQDVRNLHNLRPKADKSPEKDVVKALSSIAEKLGEYSTNSASWDQEKMDAWKAEYSDLVQTVAIPTLSFATANLVISTVIFFIFLISFNKTGHGYEDVQNFAGNIPGIGNSLKGLLSKVDDKLGNGALSLAIVDILAPISIPLAVATTPILDKWYTERFESIRESLA
eukprot:CAMPEP_0184491446 /NCGR_PEP_ID=MMETSP0113_2-20130426/20417_1 /TAXON_ID=91329 /ORGANISM="Norrisiella sphaerica, Strain BC52" /LENGTH=195 /DNA_ID=CAMNT_0026875817 /DNA_START=32 /DNA_END=615 /DNA_ORIENTATION=+